MYPELKQLVFWGQLSSLTSYFHGLIFFHFKQVFNALRLSPMFGLAADCGNLRPQSLTERTPACGSQGRLGSGSWSWVM